ncbi:MAG: NADH-quinone oxidoreductase subunit H [Candidatus Stygibacter australis]|nr:NADH-quinone oxidoreductase subunit H [Candidatus Stygibacter australis]MDP8322385.1 NADH-quinone oxidoreductase subunit H [Candidatus Stygibacter australis]
MDGLIIKIIYAFISLSVATIWGLLLGGIAMKVVARAHGRFGPPVWQPIVDIIKNNARRTSISHGIMYFLGPVFRIAGGMGTFLFIPFIFGSTVFGNFSFAGDLFLVMYFIFFGQLGMALGAGESGHPYSAIGVARGLSQMTAFELPFALSIISLVIQYGTLNITDIVAAQQGGILNWTLITNPLATIAALISLQGMNMHNPFSVVIAPQEIPIGPPTEYHSNFLGLLQTNRGLFNIAKLALFMNLYFGGATNLAMMILKTFLLYMITVIIGASFPRFRTEQSIRFFLGVPTILGILAVIIVAYL